jgi:DNA-binding MarR family transcriptional regulator
MVAKATFCAYIARMGKHLHYRTEDFRAEICIGYLISRIFSANRAELEALFEGEELSFTQWRVLMSMRDGLANTCADLSRELAHDKGSMTRLVDQLEAKKLLRRERDGEDRRLVLLRLTPAGRKSVNRLVPKLVDYYNEILARFSAQEVKLLTQLLTRLKSTQQAGDAIDRAREGERVS